MAYIGQGIKQGTFKVLDTSGNTYNGSNTTFSLGTQVGSAAQLLVSHDGVIQLPGTDYTLASGGASITFSTAPASGASIFIVEKSGAVGGTVTPSDTSVTADNLNSALLTGQTDIGANIADADLFLVDDGAGGTLRKTAASRIKTYVGGFDVSSITGATALAEQPAATDEIVLSDAGTLKRLDIKHIQNTPSFYAYKSGNTAVANATETLLTPTTEVFDSDSTYDTSNGRFTPGIAGKYFLGCSWRMDSAYADRAFARIRKNGSGDGAIKFQEYEMNPGTSGSFAGGHTTAIVTSDDDDYFDVTAYHNRGQQENVFDAVFYGFRITGV